jgi:pyruvate decarboxylase
MYEQMSKFISGATTVLNDPATAAAEIDRVLKVMLYESRPVYVGVPVDVAYVPISDEGLSSPLPRSLPPNNGSTTRQALTEIRLLLERASSPVVILDGGKYNPVYFPLIFTYQLE